jgi:hypothetical protein
MGKKPESSDRFDPVLTRMKVLIANRGEIAVRVIRACRELGIPTVAVYSDCDRASLHVRFADEAYAIGPSAPSESYLRVDKIVDVARRSGATAVHPGYGFLAENAGFARACADAGLTFIGPSPEAMVRMGSKTGARQVAIEAGVPVVPGTIEPLGPSVGDAEIASLAASIGYPVFVKAVAGGGGKGMRLVTTPDDLASRPAPKRGRRSATRTSTSSVNSSSRGTSRSSCWPTPTEPWCRLWNASARFSGGTRRCSRSRRRSPSHWPSARRSRRRHAPWRARSATPTPEPSNSCSTATAGSTSWR